MTPKFQFGDRVSIVHHHDHKFINKTGTIVNCHKSTHTQYRFMYDVELDDYTDGYRLWSLFEFRLQLISHVFDEEHDCDHSISVNSLMEVLE